MSKKSDFSFYIQIALVVILVGALMFGLGKVSGTNGNVIKTVSASGISPTGVPSIYGKELKVSYDDVS